MKHDSISSAARMLCVAACSLTGCVANNMSPAKSSAVAPREVAQHKESAWDRPGYVTFEEGGRLWVFAAGSQDLAKFKEHGEPVKMVVLPGAGPNGMTLKGTDRKVMLEYALSKPGFQVFVDDGRLWVFAAGSPDLAKFLEHGEPAKMVVRPGAGPRGMTLKSVDGSVLDAYMAR
jgi:hypothetical protein